MDDQLYVNQKPDDENFPSNHHHHKYHSQETIEKKQEQEHNSHKNDRNIQKQIRHKDEEPKIVQNQPLPAPRLQTAATKIPLPGLKFSKQIGIDFLSFLESIPSLFITQKVDIIEAVTAVSRENKFAIIDPEGHCRLVASEKSGFCDRLLCGLNRSFRLQIRDIAGNLCLELERSTDCSLCCGLLFPDRINVYLPNEVPIGSITQRKHIKPSYSIKNALGETKFLLEGGWCPIHCPGHDTHFEMLEYRWEDQLGKIKPKRLVHHNGLLVKNWVGCGKELCTEADDFVLQFPTDTSPNMKALCLAAVFMINMRHFEAKAWVPKIAYGILSL